MAQLKIFAPLPSAEMRSLHGPLVILGFLFTWLGLERVSAMNRWWVYGVSLLSVLSALSLILQLPAVVAPFFAANAALLLAWCFADLYQHHHEDHFIMMVLSAAESTDHYPLLHQICFLIKLQFTDFLKHRLQS